MDSPAARGTATAGQRRAHLPADVSGFVGRPGELARLTRLLRRSRLVTVTGPGGVGKTRLAARGAASASGGFRDGAAFIELSAVRDPGLVDALADGLAGPGAGAGAPLDRLLGFVRGRELLLVLDTCEHLADGCAALADTILREAPGVVILATSRQPLDAPAEAVFPLGPLPVPGVDAESAGQGDAVELFAQRAAAAVPGFTVTPENLPDVIAVCRRLDGIPLAIELAAVRLRALPLRQMAEGIDDRLRLLTGGRRSGTPRHQSLRAAIEWSYSLCTPAERLLWARLSVFAGGFDLAAAEDVCAGGELPAGAVAPAVRSLAAKSVLARDDVRPDGTQPAGPAFRMLGTLREFGAERLHQAGTGQAEAAVRRRFIARCLTLAERFEQTPASGQLARYQRLRREHANLRAAFDYALDLPGNDGAAVVLATSLFVYWQISGLLPEAEHWLDQALERCPPRSAARARVLSTRGYVRALLGDFAAATADATAAVTAAATFGDAAVGGRGYSALHRTLAFSGDFAAAQQAGRSAVACLTAAGDTLGLAQLDVVEAMLRLQAGEPDRCRESAAQGLARLPDGELWCTAALHGLAALGLFLGGDIGRARPLARRSLALRHQISDLTGTAFGLGTLAFIAAAEGRHQHAAWLLGTSAPLWESAGRWYTGAPAFESLHQVAERVARSGLGDDGYWRARAAGAAAPLDQAVERALGDGDEPPPAGVKEPCAPGRVP